MDPPSSSPSNRQRQESQAGPGPDPDIVRVVTTVERVTSTWTYFADPNRQPEEATISRELISSTENKNDGKPGLFGTLARGFAGVRSALTGATPPSNNSSTPFNRNFGPQDENENEIEIPGAFGAKASDCQVVLGGKRAPAADLSARLPSLGFVPTSPQEGTTKGAPETAAAPPTASDPSKDRSVQPGSDPQGGPARAALGDQSNDQHQPIVDATPPKGSTVQGNSSGQAYPPPPPLVSGALQNSWRPPQAPQVAGTGSVAHLGGSAHHRRSDAISSATSRKPPGPSNQPAAPDLMNELQGALLKRRRTFPSDLPSNPSSADKSTLPKAAPPIWTLSKAEPSGSSNSTFKIPSSSRKSYAGVPGEVAIAHVGSLTSSSKQRSGSIAKNFDSTSKPIAGVSIPLKARVAPVEVTGAWKPLFEVLGNYHFHNLVEIWPSAVGEADKVFTSHLFQLLDGSGIMQFGNLYQQVMLSFSREDAVWSPSLSWKMEMNTRFVFAIGRSVLSRVFKDAINNDPGAVDLRPLIKNDDVENAIGHIQSGYAVKTGKLTCREVKDRFTKPLIPRYASRFPEDQLSVVKTRLAHTILLVGSSDWMADDDILTLLLSPSELEPAMNAFVRSCAIPVGHHALPEGDFFKRLRELGSLDETSVEQRRVLLLEAAGRIKEAVAANPSNFYVCDSPDSGSFIKKSNANPNKRVRSPELDQGPVARSRFD